MKWTKQINLKLKLKSKDVIRNEIFESMKWWKE